MKRTNHVEQRKHPSLARRVQNLVHARDGQLTEAADLAEFLVVDSYSNASRLVRNDHQRARIWKGRVLNSACPQLVIEGGVDLLDRSWVDPMGLWSDGRAIFLDRNLDKHQGVRTQNRHGLEKTSAKSQRTSPSRFIANGV